MNNKKLEYSKHRIVAVVTVLVMAFLFVLPATMVGAEDVIEEEEVQSGEIGTNLIEQDGSGLTVVTSTPVEDGEGDLPADPAQGTDDEQEGDGGPALPAEDELPPEPAVLFTFAELAVEQDSEGVDLTEGAAAVDELGEVLDVALVDDGGFDVSAPQVYTLTYEAVHAELGAVTETRDVVVYEKIQLMMATSSVPFSGTVPDGSVLFYTAEDTVELYAAESEIGGGEPFLTAAYTGGNIAGENYTIILDDGCQLHTAQIAATGDLALKGAGGILLSADSGTVSLQVDGALHLDIASLNVVGVSGTLPILAGSVHLAGGVVETAGQTTAAISCKGDMTVSGGTLTANSKRKLSAVYVTGALIMTGGGVTGHADGELNQMPTAVDADSITVSNGATLCGSSLRGGVGVNARTSMVVDNATVTGYGMTGVHVCNGDLTIRNNGIVSGNIRVQAGMPFSAETHGVQITGAGHGPGTAGSLIMQSGGRIITSTEDTRVGTYYYYGVKIDNRGKSITMSGGSSIETGFVGKIPNIGLHTSECTINLDNARIKAQGISQGMYIDGPVNGVATGGTHISLTNGAVMEGYGKMPDGRNVSTYGIFFGKNTFPGNTLYIDAASTMIGISGRGDNPANSAYHVGISISMATVNIEGTIIGECAGHNYSWGLWFYNCDVDLNGATVKAVASSTYEGGNTAGLHIGRGTLPASAVFTIRGGATVQCTGPMYGINTYMRIDIDGADTAVTVEATKSGNAIGIVTQDPLNITGGAIVTSKANAGHSGVNTYGGPVYIDGGSALHTEGGTLGLSGGAVEVIGSGSVLTGAANSAGKTTAGMQVQTLQATGGAKVSGTGGTSATSFGVNVIGNANVDASTLEGASGGIGIGASNLTVGNESVVTASGGAGAGGTGLRIVDTATQHGSLHLSGDSVVTAAGGWRGATVEGDVVQNGGSLTTTGASAPVPIAGAAGAYVGGDIDLSGDALFVTKAVTRIAGFDGIYIGGTKIQIDGAHLDAWTESYDNTAATPYSAINGPGLTTFDVKGDGKAEEHYNIVFYIRNTPVDPAAKDPTMGDYNNYTWSIGTPGKIEFSEAGDGMVAAANSYKDVAFSAHRTGSDKRTGSEPVALLTPGSVHQIHFGGANTYIPLPPKDYWVRYESALHEIGALPDDAIVQEGAIYGIAGAQLGRTGYVFAGWRSDYDGQIYQPGEVITMPSQDVTFTAVWNAVGGGDTEGPETPTTPQAPQNPGEPEDYTTIYDPNNPLSSGRNKNAWSLVNLLLSLVTLATAVLLVLRGRNKNDAEEEDDEDESKVRRLWKWLGVLAGLLTPVLFLLFEDLRLPMTIVNRLTVVFALMTLIQLVTVAIYRAVKKQYQTKPTTQTP